jgi:hypothetical protein
VSRNLSVPHGENIGHAECHLLALALYAECVEIFSNRSADDSKHRHTVIDRQCVLDRRGDVGNRVNDAGPPLPQLVSAAWTRVGTVLNKIVRKQLVDLVQAMLREDHLQRSLYDLNICVPRHHLTSLLTTSGGTHNNTPVSIATTSTEVLACRLPRTTVYGAFAMGRRLLAVSGRHTKTECLDDDAQLISAADNRIDAAWVSKDAIRCNIFRGVEAPPTTTIPGSAAISVR